MDFSAVDLEQQINQLSLNTVYIASIILIVGTFAASRLKKHKKLKTPLFLLLASTMVISTAILFVSTIYLNQKSESKGPVHWHTDIEFWSCGAEIELRDPHGWLSNKIGSSTYHEHNDKRIHLEGVVIHKQKDASLTKFMRVTGGYLMDDRIAIPLDKRGEDFKQSWFATQSDDKVDGDFQNSDNFTLAVGGMQWIENTKDGPILILKNGEYCRGSDKEPAELQVFVYSFNKDNNTYSQSKLAKPTDYLMRDESIVPPGDCVIVEFDQPRAKTDKLCQQYGVRDSSRCSEFGVKEYSSQLCNIRETQ